MSPQRVQTLRSSTKNTRPTAGTREPGELFVSFADLQLGVINAGRVAQDLIAVRFFSAATNYAAGDFVINGGIGYRAKNTIVAGAFNAADWDSLTTAPAMLLKEDKINPGTTLQYWRGDKTWQTLDKNAVGLDQVNNTSDTNKPVSTAQATADALRVAKTGDVMSGHLILPLGPAAANAVRKDYVDLGDANLTNAVALKADIASPTLTGDPRAPTPATSDNDTSIATTAYVKAQGYVTDAPSDTNAYGRKAAAWVDVTEEAPLDSLTYGRKNGTWATMVGGAVISDTPPPGPLQAGQLWWESDSGAMFLWYIDPGGGGGQWVQVNNATAPGATAQTRNRLVNPAMQISQEYGNAAETFHGSAYLADQWASDYVLSTGVVTRQRVQVVTPNGSLNRYRMTVTTADTSIAADEYAEVFQSIEGIRVADFQWGTSAAKQVVVRFGWKSPAGTYAVSIANDGSNRVYIANFTIAAGQANTDTVQTFVIPGDVAGTWSKDTGVGMFFTVVIAAGANFIGPLGWSSGGIAAAGVSNGVATAGAVYELFDVSLHLDPDATGIPPKWVMPDEAQELATCQRYWERTGGNQHVFSGNVVAGSNYYKATGWKVQKRVTPPSVTGANLGTSGNFSAAVGSLAADAYGFYEFRAATVTGNGAYFQSDIIGNARM